MEEKRRRQKPGREAVSVRMYDKGGVEYISGGAAIPKENPKVLMGNLAAAEYPRTRVIVVDKGRGRRKQGQEQKKEQRESGKQWTARKGVSHEGYKGEGRSHLAVGPPFTHPSRNFTPYPPSLPKP